MNDLNNNYEKINLAIKYSIGISRYARNDKNINNNYITKYNKCTKQ